MAEITQEQIERNIPVFLKLMARPSQGGKWVEFWIGPLAIASRDEMLKRGLIRDISFSWELTEKGWAEAKG